MKPNKLLTSLLLCLLMTSVQAWSAEPQYTRAQVDSIVAAEVARQLKDQQIELQIERVSNEKYAHSLAEQNKRLVEHDHKMSSRYTWMGLLFTVLVAFSGVLIPIWLRNDYKKQLDDVTKKVEEMRDAAEKSRVEAEESAKQAKASEYFSQALAEKDLDKQIELYTKAIDLKPDYANAYNNRGIAYYHKGDCDKAMADFNKAINLKPDDESGYNNRGELRYKMGDYKGSIEDCSRAIGLDPDGVESESYYYRSLSYKALGGDENLQLALADAQKGLEVARRLGSRSLVEVKQFEDLIREPEGELKG